MKRFIVEREIPEVGQRSISEMREIAGRSNDALAQLAPRVQWQESFIAADKTFCVYLAEDEEAIHEHSRISGIPLVRITEIRKLSDPTMGPRKR
ncbi:MAG: DUF4242 domain-containing protein [Rhodovibrionaceae bacterium]|nr:DUF4242 domain-containing protein [Rhodovibrionaceae bacterium]